MTAARRKIGAIPKMTRMLEGHRYLPKNLRQGTKSTQKTVVKLRRRQPLELNHYGLKVHSFKLATWDNKYPALDECRKYAVIKYNSYTDFDQHLYQSEQHLATLLKRYQLSSILKLSRPTHETPRR